MILDELNEFADGTTVTGAAGTRNVGDTIPLHVARDIGNGEPIYAYILVDTAPTGADTVEFKLVSDATDTPATNGDATEHFTTGAVPVADLPAGKRFVFPLPSGLEYEGFLGLQVTNVGSSPLADLAVSSGLTPDMAGWRAYPDADN